MKTYRAKEPPSRKVRTSTQDAGSAAPAREPIHSQPVFLCDDLRTRIAKRAYEIHAERGYRYGYALEDWLEAERETLEAEYNAS